MSGNRRVIVRQPIDLGDGKCHPLSRGGPGAMWSVLRPGAFYWHAGRLYVGYSWLSTLHEGEEPVWDPKPVPENAVVETCRGYYHFSGMFVEKAPYFRKYAELSVRYIHEPSDYGDGFLKKQIDQGRFDFRENIIIPPDYYVEYQWHGGGGGGHALLNRRLRDHRKVMPKIRKAPSLEMMRSSPQAKELRKEFTKDNWCIHGLRPE